jgi:N-acetyl-1-D-myo-inositol-2-amino-2-deoxy-alpha-D-glucopyranoside deacetylase
MLFVHAHPDDETTTTGATAARYAAEGVGVQLVTCTLGERGEILDPDVRARLADLSADRAAASLGEHRARELAAACRALGIAPARLLGGNGRWWDSGMAGTPTNHHARALVSGDLDTQTRSLAGIILSIRPQVVVTYDERGGYGHPDHIRAHEITLAAVAAVSPRWPVSKVYACVIPGSVLRSAALLLTDAPIDGPNPLALIDDPQALPFGVADEQVTTAIDAGDWFDNKIAAMRAHRSQMHANGWFFTLAQRSDAALATEYYQLLLRDGLPPGTVGSEDDLFAGLRAHDMRTAATD